MTQITNIYFDLDGPILDVSDRYYRVHKDICERLSIKNALTKEEYWSKKRDRTPIHILLDCLKSDNLVFSYNENWISEIEKDSMLKHDKIFPYAKDILEYLSNKYALFLVTFRRRKESVLDEICKFGIKKYFKDIFVVSSENKEEEHFISKYNAIKNSSSFCSKSLFIGDTEIDIKAAKLLGIKSVGVLSGIRNRGYMKELDPDYIFTDLEDLVTGLNL